MHVQATSRPSGQLMRVQGRHVEYGLASGSPDATTLQSADLAASSCVIAGVDRRLIHCNSVIP